MPESDLEIYKAFRGQIEHESTLVGIRLGWLIAAEAFLAAAYATVLTVPGGHHQPENFVPQAKLLYTALPIAGIVRVELAADIEPLEPKRERGDVPMPVQEAARLSVVDGPKRLRREGIRLSGEGDPREHCRRACAAGRTRPRETRPRRPTALLRPGATGHRRWFGRGRA